MATTLVAAIVMVPAMAIAVMVVMALARETPLYTTTPEEFIIQAAITSMETVLAIAACLIALPIQVGVLTAAEAVTAAVVGGRAHTIKYCSVRPGVTQSVPPIRWPPKPLRPACSGASRQPFSAQSSLLAFHGCQRCVLPGRSHLWRRLEELNYGVFTPYHRCGVSDKIITSKTKGQVP